MAAFATAESTSMLRRIGVVIRFSRFYPPREPIVGDKIRIEKISYRWLAPSSRKGANGLDHGAGVTFGSPSPPHAVVEPRISRPTEIRGAKTMRCATDPTALPPHRKTLNEFINITAVSKLKLLLCSSVIAPPFEQRSIPPRHIDHLCLELIRRL
jgi:hypothetical protein